MSFTRHWKASLDLNDSSGLAEYTINGRQYTLSMTSFRNFTLVGELLDYVFIMGLNHGKDWMASRVREVLVIEDYHDEQPAENEAARRD
jgi:hypothetical protein